MNECQSQVSLRVLGTNLDFKAISREIGHESVETHRAGDSLLQSRRYTHDVWLLSCSLDRTEPLGRHLAWLRERLQPHYQFLQALRNKANVNAVNIYCGVTVRGEYCDFSLEPQVLDVFVEAGAEMELGIVFIGEEDAAEGLCEGTKNPGELPDAQSSNYGNGHKGHRQESQVSLWVVSDCLNVEDISEVFGFRPSQAQLSASSIVRKADPFHSWVVQSPLAKTEALDAHLKWLIGKLTSRPQSIDSLKKSAQIFVICDVATECEWGSTWISADALRLPVTFSIPMNFHVRLI